MHETNTTAFYLNNLKVLRDHIAQRPALRLAAYTTTAERLGHTCGTLHCLAGEIPTIQHFINMGVQADHLGAPTFRTTALVSVDHAMKRLFGAPEDCNPWEALAQIRDFGCWDKELDHSCMHDKELALARLDRAIAYYTKQGE